MSNSFKKHLIVAHQNTCSYQCKKCPKEFSECETLKGHMKTYSGEKPFTCDQCSKAFSAAGVLQNHMITHSGEKPFT